MKLVLVLMVGSMPLAGCTSLNLNNALGTPKNPTPIFAKPEPPEAPRASRENDENPKDVGTQTAIILPLYNVLLTASDPKNDMLKPVGSDNMRRYLGAGFALSDIYCARFFIKTDEAYRRRRFGRTLTNDVGTAMTTILGLANAGQNIVTGVAAGFGFGDSVWRNYDDSFIVSPDLSNVQSLVHAAQDNFRARTLGKNLDLPADYGTAQSVILRYSTLCSFLGMKTLLDQSATDQRTKLNKDTEAQKQAKTTEANTKQPSSPGSSIETTPASAAPTPPPETDTTAPLTATPSITSNQQTK